jgi:phosphoribosylanthranilate isomerase
MWIKIEGLRDPDIARRVVELGASAIGLVFAPSPRQVTPQAAAAIVAALPPEVHKVGVFVNAPPDEINRVRRISGITHVQLHGGEPPSIVPMIQDAAVIKAFRVRDELTVPQALSWLAQLDPPSRQRVTPLFDAYDPHAPGGTGRSFNWKLLAPIQGMRFILAGGLAAGNVRQAAQALAPWGVDVASGVESAPGIKDLALVEAFITALAGL